MEPAAAIVVPQYRMGLTSEADFKLVDLRAMDTAEDVIVRFVRFVPNNSSGRLRLLLRNELQFEAAFSDGSKQWMLWAEAKQMAALDTYASEHKLKLPATWQVSR